MRLLGASLLLPIVVSASWTDWFGQRRTAADGSHDMASGSTTANAATDDAQVLIYLTPGGGSVGGPRTSTAGALTDDNFNLATQSLQGKGAIDQFLADRQALVDHINDPATDLFAPLPNSGAHQHNIVREIEIIGAHNAYHTGEIGTLRQLMGLWHERT